MAEDKDQQPLVKTETDAPSKKKNMKVLFRKNIFFILLVAYATVGLVFAGMVLSGVKGDVAYGLMGNLFATLIGGTLAIAKDLIEK